MASLANEKYFDRTQLGSRTALGALSEFDDSFLGARGFNARGERVGGITTPKQVIVPAGALLVRTFGGGARQVGQWWFSVFELKSMLSHAGHSDLVEGRDAGKGLLHAFLAILRNEWKSTCESFGVAALVEPLYAFYGAGDHAVYGPDGGQKAALMWMAGRQRGMRQLFLPRLWEYSSTLVWRIPHGDVDRELAATCGQLPAAPLPFEL